VRATSLFGQKLTWLKKTARVSDDTIGAAVGFSESQVCRWRSGERSLDQVKGARVLAGLADFFLRQFGQRGQTATLARELGIDASLMTPTNRAYYAAFVRFLYSSHPVPAVGAVRDATVTTDGQVCHFGARGLVDALHDLARRSDASPVTIYLSLEHAKIIRSEASKGLWQALRELGDGPVRVVFDTWTNADEAAATLRALLPHMQAGDLRLHLIKLPQKFFYNNITFLAGDAMVLTAEPAGGRGDPVSMLVDSPSYFQGMSAVFAQFDKNTKPVERHLNVAANDEAQYFAQLYEPGDDLLAAIDGVDLLYLGVDDYARLLSLNDIPDSQRVYRLKRFASDKQRFEQLLESDRVTEVLNLDALDDMVRTRCISTPDMSFHRGKIFADETIVAGVFKGITDYLRRYANLSVALSRGGWGFSYRLKGDRFALLHSASHPLSDEPEIVWTDTWLLVFEYVQQFEKLLGDDNLISSRSAVMAALRMRQTTK